MNAAARKKTRRARRSRGGSRASARKRWWVLGGVVFGVGCLIAGLFAWLWRAASVPGERAGFTSIVLATDTANAVSQSLHDQGFVRSAFLVWAVKHAFFPRANFVVGEHWIERGSSVRELVECLVRSRSRAKVRVSLPEGWDSYQMGERLASAGVCSKAGFLGAVHDPGRARALLQHDSLEGYLYPATYEFLLDSAPEVIAERLVQEGLKRLDSVVESAEERLAQLGPNGLSEFELVTLASVVQKEAADREEYGRIAGVFLNRLRDADFRPLHSLQSDPTAAYGCKRLPELASCRAANGRVTREILRDAANPYNSYKHPGLPPGPIGNPSSDVLQAILAAPPTDALFFFAPRGGRHTFSRSLEEHNAAITRSSGAPAETGRSPAP